MRKVCRLAREVLDIAAAAIRPGITTDYIDEIVHKACIERNVSSSTASVLCPRAQVPRRGSGRVASFARRRVCAGLDTKTDNFVCE